jgi:hypothetical protein
MACGERGAWTGSRCTPWDVIGVGPAGGGAGPAGGGAATVGGAGVLAFAAADDEGAPLTIDWSYVGGGVVGASLLVEAMIVVVKCEVDE